MENTFLENWAKPNQVNLVEILLKLAADFDVAVDVVVVAAAAAAAAAADVAGGSLASNLLTVVLK